MNAFRCEEVKTLPKMTLRGNSRTTLELRSRFKFTHFSLEFEESLPDGLLQVSEDLFTEMNNYLSSQAEPLGAL
ncbi:MAG: hypothetical protein HUJ26_02515 [Planctomycetaceae bacterium]|nr:hypothetical protein [Planctomycetaceae bacterium]